MQLLDAIAAGGSTSLGIGFVQSYLPVMTRYIGESHLKQVLVAILQAEALTICDLGLAIFPGPYLPGNWQITWFAVHPFEFDLVQSTAEEIRSSRKWVMVPDRNPLDGLVYVADAELDAMSARFECAQPNFLTTVGKMRRQPPH